MLFSYSTSRCLMLLVATVCFCLGCGKKQVAESVALSPTDAAIERITDEKFEQLLTDYLIPSESTLTRFVGTQSSDPETVKPQSETEAVDEVLHELSQLDDIEDALSRLNILFDAAEQDPQEFAPAAIYAARRITTEEPFPSEFAEAAQVFLLQLSFEREGASQWLFDSLAKFARDYADSDRPILLYRQIASQLATSGEGVLAISLLQHGIQHCASHRDVTLLERHYTSTLQTISILGHISAGNRRKGKSPNSQEPSAGKPTLTDVDSKYYGLIGQQVNLRGTTFAGKKVALEDFRGQWVYLHFWASWCEACKKDLPRIIEQRATLSGKNIQFVGVNLDPDQSAARKLLAQNQEMNWPQFVTQSQNGWDAVEAKSLGLTVLPTALLVSPTGKVLEAGNGKAMPQLIAHQLGL